MMLLGWGADIADDIVDFFHFVLIFIDQVIFSFVGWLYKLFMLLATFNPFDIDVYNEFVGRIYLILGVVMMFILTYNLLQGVINPDSVEKGENTPQKFLLNIVISISLVAVLPTIFDFIGRAQNAIIKGNVLTYLILGGNRNENTQGNEEEYNFTNAGNEMALTVWSPFFQVTDDYCDYILKENEAALVQVEWIREILNKNNLASVKDLKGKTRVEICETFIPDNEHYPTGNKWYEDLFKFAATALTSIWGATYVGTPIGGAAVGWNMSQKIIDSWHQNPQRNATLSFTKEYVKIHGNFVAFLNYSEATFTHKGDGTPDFTMIDHKFPVSTIAGVYLCICLVSYCFDMGKRIVKLLFLQIISPIAAIARAMPKGKDIFNNWLKLLISVYLEVFVRILSLFFGVFLIKYLLSPENDGLWDYMSDYGNLIAVFGMAFVVMGIIAFVRELPKFLGNIFPKMNSDNMSLNIAEKFKNGGGFAALGFVGGTVAGHGNPLAGFRAAKSADKNMNFTGVGREATRTKNKKAALRAGATRSGIFMDNLRRRFGFESSVDAADRKLESKDYEVTDKDGNIVKMTDSKKKSLESTREANNKQIEEINQRNRQKNQIVEDNEKVKSARSTVKTEALDQIHKDDSYLRRAIRFRKSAKAINDDLNAYNASVKENNEKVDQELFDLMDRRNAPGSTMTDAEYEAQKAAIEARRIDDATADAKRTEIQNNSEMTITGNYNSLNAQLQQLRNSGVIDGDQVTATQEQLAKAEESMYQHFVDDAMRGYQTTLNSDGTYEEMHDADGNRIELSNGVIPEAIHILRSDAEAGTFKDANGNVINMAAGDSWASLNGLFKQTSAVNSGIRESHAADDREKQRLERENAGIQSMFDQVEKKKAVAKQKDSYRAKQQASSFNDKNQNK